jgi:hypothetical protein
MGATLGPKAVQQMEEIARRVLSGVRNTGGHRARWMGRGSGRNSCPERNEIHQLTLIGSPTTGTLELSFTIDAVTDSVTLNYDDTASEVEDQMETHSEVGAGQVSVSGGPLPDATITIEFTGTLAGTAILPPVLTWGTLSGTGVAAIVSRPQSGHPH